MKKIFTMSVFLLFASTIFPQNIVNGGFEQGAAGWQIYSSNGAALIGTADFFSSSSITPTVYPRSGNYMARLGGFGYAENALGQTVTLPNLTNVYLHVFFQDRAASTSECSGLWVGARIRIIIAGQTLLDTYLCDYNVVTNWTHVYFDLSAVAGQTIDIVFRADAANSVWSYLYIDDIFINSSVTGVQEDLSLPEEFILSQNYPNPFNPSTTINYEIPIRSRVKLEVFNIQGERVSLLSEKNHERGNYTYNFDAGDNPSGIYLCKLTAIDENGETTVRQVKMMLIK